MDQLCPNHWWHTSPEIYKLKQASVYWMYIMMQDWLPPYHVMIIVLTVLHRLKWISFLREESTFHFSQSVMQISPWNWRCSLPRDWNTQAWILTSSWGENLTHCDLWTLQGNVVFGWHWLRWWLAAWRHQSTPWAYAAPMLTHHQWCFVVSNHEQFKIIAMSPMWQWVEWLTDIVWQSIQYRCILSIKIWTSQILYFVPLWTSCRYIDM